MKCVYCVCESDAWGRNPVNMGIFTTFKKAVSALLKNGRFDKDDLEEYGGKQGIRNFIEEHWSTPNLRTNYSIREIELNVFEEW